MVVAVKNASRNVCQEMGRLMGGEMRDEGVIDGATCGVKNILRDRRALIIIRLNMRARFLFPYPLFFLFHFFIKPIPILNSFYTVT